MTVRSGLMAEACTRATEVGMDRPPPPRLQRAKPGEPSEGLAKDGRRAPPAVRLFFRVSFPRRSHSHEA